MGIIGWAYALLPISLRIFWVRSLGLALRITGWRREVVEKNLLYAFPENSSVRSQLFKSAYQHLAQLSLEILMLFGALKWFVRRHAEIRGFEIWQRAHAQGCGVIMLSSHVGNWEIMAARAGFQGVDIMIVTKRLQPSWLHRAVEQGRLKCGVKGTYEPRTFRDVLSHLKKNGSVGFVLDQYAGPPVGVRVPFFDVPVGTMTAVAALARRTGAPVVPVVNYRTPEGRVVLEVRPALKWIEDASPQVEIAKNTALYVSEMERDVRAHPEQWLWVHRRFKGDLSPLRPGEWEAGRRRE